jgi:hypothetical protein
MAPQDSWWSISLISSHLHPLIKTCNFHLKTFFPILLSGLGSLALWWWSPPPSGHLGHYHFFRLRTFWRQATKSMFHWAAALFKTKCRWIVSREGFKVTCFILGLPGEGQRCHLWCTEWVTFWWVDWDFLENATLPSLASFHFSNSCAGYLLWSVNKPRLFPKVLDTS